MTTETTTLSSTATSTTAVTNDTAPLSPTTLASLIQTINEDRRIAQEVLQKIPQLVTGSETQDVYFRTKPDTTLPTFRKMMAQFKDGAYFNEMTNRMNDIEGRVINLIGETVRIGQTLGKGRQNPSWTSIDLLESNQDGDTANPLYSAAVDSGLRFAPEAIVNNSPAPKLANTVTRIGAWITPTFTETKEARFVESTLSSVSPVDLYQRLMRNSGQTTVTKVRTVVRSYTTSYTYQRYYGGYYYWRTLNYTQNNTQRTQKLEYVEQRAVSETGYRTHYYNAQETYQEKQVVYSEPEVKSLDNDFAVIGQTFYCHTPRVITAFEYYEYNPGSRTNATRKYFLCRCRDGRPLLDDVITEGTAVAAHLASNQSPSPIRVNFNQPTLLEGGVQYALVIMFNNQIYIYQSYQLKDIDRTGQLMMCKDHFLWEKIATGGRYDTNIQSLTQTGSAYHTLDDSLDLMYSLYFADWGNETTKEIALPNFDLVGGISTAKVKFNAQMPNSGTNIETMVKLNGSWQPLSVLDNNVHLPPSVEAKLVLTGTQNVMPLINVEQSNYQLFRPKDILNFISKPRKRNTSNIVKIAIDLAGFDPRYHLITCQLLVGDNLTQVNPEVTVKNNATDNSTGSLRYDFQLPTGTEDYRIKINASTKNASIGFDISSIVEL